MNARSEAPADPAIDWAAARDETVHLLQRLIQFDTRNPPGNELAVARYIESVLADDGIQSEVVETSPGRGAVVGRISGTRAGGKPLMLLAHTDVVAVEPEHWSVDPFAGVVQNGYVYGRGAIDDKGMLAANLMCMLLLQRFVVNAGKELARDVVFVAVPDEEAGGTHGMKWLLRNRPELLDAEFALNEGGRLRINGGRLLYGAIQTAEKVSHVVQVTARGPSGHASVPRPGNAVARLARAVARIAEHREAMQLLPTTRHFFKRLSSVWPDAREADAMGRIGSDNPHETASGADVLSNIPVFDALLRTGIAPTIVQGGSQSNVIPAEASAVLCIRTLPGASIDDVVSRLADLVDDHEVEIKITSRGDDAPESLFESGLFQALEETLRELAPSIVTVPYMSTGATDSAQLRRVGVQALGLLPFPLEEADERRMHGHDERVSVAALEFGTRLVFGSVRRVVG